MQQENCWQCLRCVSPCRSGVRVATLRLIGIADERRYFVPGKRTALLHVVVDQFAVQRGVIIAE